MPVSMTISASSPCTLSPSMPFSPPPTPPPPSSSPVGDGFDWQICDFLLEETILHAQWDHQFAQGNTVVLPSPSSSMGAIRCLVIKVTVTDADPHLQVIDGLDVYEIACALDVVICAVGMDVEGEEWPDTLNVRMRWWMNGLESESLVETEVGPMCGRWGDGEAEYITTMTWEHDMGLGVKKRQNGTTNDGTGQRQEWHIDSTGWGNE
ncbi:hypothetical protein K439DRAFT_1505675 [Ramaria rubella]|nr:hypothetical protein K439DRAFT_1505675 [Ramaria rubella]